MLALKGSAERKSKTVAASQAERKSKTVAASQAG
jgi:hypothetical protein